MDVLIGQDHLVDEDGRVGTDGGNDVAQDLAAFVVWPVVEDVAEVVEFGSCTTV